MIEVIRVDDFDLRLFGDGYETLIWIQTGVDACAETLRHRLPHADVRIHAGAGEHLVEVKADRFLSEEEIVDLRASASLGRVRRVGPVLPVLSHPGIRLPFTTAAEMLRHDAGRGTALGQLGLDYEMARSRMDSDALSQRMRALIALLKESIAQGTAGTQHGDRILGPQSAQFQQCLQSGKLLDGGMLNRMVLYVSALMEVKSSMGVIVAAPTAGACAAFPGAVIAAAEVMDLPEEKLVQAFFAAGLIGVFIATRWTFAAEVGGCQAEGGAAAAIAAAGLVTLKDGSLAQCLAAASMALQNMLGLICDPVANRVEVPCLGKNVLAASNALSCANLALAGYDPVIPLDEVIDAARAVSEQMPRELRCTGLGGLATTPTSLALQEKLAVRIKNPAGCGTCHCD
jgi:L-serine dehydratase